MAKHKINTEKHNLLLCDLLTCVASILTFINFISTKLATSCFAVITGLADKGGNINEKENLEMIDINSVHLNILLYVCQSNTRRDILHNPQAICSEAHISLKMQYAHQIDIFSEKDIQQFVVSDNAAG